MAEILQTLLRGGDARTLAQSELGRGLYAKAVRMRRSVEQQKARLP